MKPRYRRQRVILREKVRKERLQWFTHGVLKWFFRTALIAAVVFMLARANRLLFHSSFFMVKSVAVISGENPRISAKIQRQLESLKGNSIFSFSAGSLEEDLKEQFSSVRSLNIMRSFPDHIDVQYEMRKPIAIVKMESEDSVASHKIKLLDENGTVYAQEISRDSRLDIPEVIVASTYAVASASRFLRCWTKENKNNTTVFSSGSLRQLYVDAWGDATLVVHPQENQNGAMQIVWGRTDSDLFPEKFKRLGQVLADLSEKESAAEYVNLKQVPEEIPLTLGDKKIVGRVIVRPAAKIEPNQLKG